LINALDVYNADNRKPIRPTKKKFLISNLYKITIQIPKLQNIKISSRVYYSQVVTFLKTFYLLVPILKVWYVSVSQQQKHSFFLHYTLYIKVCLTTKVSTLPRPINLIYLNNETLIDKFFFWDFERSKEFIAFTKIRFCDQHSTRRVVKTLQF